MIVLPTEEDRRVKCKWCGDARSEHMSLADGLLLRPFKVGNHISGACRSRHMSGGRNGISQTCGCRGFEEAA